MDGTLVTLVHQWLEAALVVGARTLVVHGHEAIALEVDDRNNGFVDREMRVVDAESVTVGVWVGEEAGLQDRVCRSLDVGDKVRRREGDLNWISLDQGFPVVKANRPVRLPRNSFQRSCSTQTCQWGAGGSPCEARPW